MNTDRFRKWINVKDNNISQEKINKLVQQILILKKSNPKHFSSVESLNNDINENKEKQLSNFEKKCIETYKHYLEEEKIINELKNKQDYPPYEYDGSYELVQETIRSYTKTDENKLDVADLDLIYSMVIGSWKAGKSIREQRVENSNLPQVEKEKMRSILNKVFQKSSDGEYTLHKKSGYVGMFGTGFFSFNGKSDSEDAVLFTSLCKEVLQAEDDERALKVTNQFLKTNMKGIGIATVSEILHCIRPNTFMIINGPIINKLDIFKLEDVNFNKVGYLKNYVDNTKQANLETRNAILRISGF